MERAQLRSSIERVADPEVLRSLLFGLLDRIDGLEDRLGALQGSPEAKGGGVALAEKQERLERIRHGITELTERMQRPYVMSAELTAVKNVLETLSGAGICNSVLLEGEPGTGKTQWAYSEVGQELAEEREVVLIHVRVKETMTAQDLLYRIDDVRRLSDAQTKTVLPEELQREAQQWKTKILAGDVVASKSEEYRAFREKMQAVIELGKGAKDLDYMNYVELGPLGEAIYQSSLGKKVWLVIDEIEKGREELMTGMLDEIENLEFGISETGTRVKGDKRNMRIVITTNTEDSDKIPSSFRRRSLYHFIEYPTRKDMAQIVELNFPDIRRQLLDYALNVFMQYHSHPDIEKKPSIPELLAWIQVLQHEYPEGLPDSVPHKEVLLKYQQDRALEIGLMNAAVAEEMEQRQGEVPHYIERALQGGTVYRVNPDINEHHRQEQFAGLYAGLENAGINFMTPQFDERQGEYDYDAEDYRKEYTRTGEFRIIAPGVEYLGDGHYAVTTDDTGLQEIMTQIADRQLEVRTGRQQFTEVTEKNVRYTKGRLQSDQSDVEAYLMADGRTVVSVPRAEAAQW